jgi:hypothetical protein
MAGSSVRDPILTDHFWLNPLSQHFSQICVSDLILVNEDGDVVVGDEPINAAAFAIHSESKFSCSSQSSIPIQIFIFYTIHVSIPISIPMPDLHQSTKLAQTSMRHATPTQSTARHSPPSAAP